MTDSLSKKTHLIKRHYGGSVLPRGIHLMVWACWWLLDKDLNYSGNLVYHYRMWGDMITSKLVAWKPSIQYCWQYHRWAPQHYNDYIELPLGGTRVGKGSREISSRSFVLGTSWPLVKDGCSVSSLPGVSVWMSWESLLKQTTRALQPVTWF